MVAKTVAATHFFSGWSAAQIAVAATVLVVVVAGIIVGVLFGVGVIGAGATEVTPTVASPTVGTNVSPTVVTTVIATATVTPIPTVTQSFRSGTASIFPGANDTYPGSLTAVTFSSALPRIPSVVITAATSKLMPTFLCSPQLPSLITTTSFSTLISSCNNATTQLVGYTTAVNTTDVVAATNCTTSGVGSSNGLPLILSTNANALLAKIADNAAGTAWTSSVTSFTGTAASPAACSVILNAAGTGYPIAIYHLGTNSTATTFRWNAATGPTFSGMPTANSYTVAMSGNSTGQDCLGACFTADGRPFVFIGAAGNTAYIAVAPVASPINTETWTTYNIGASQNGCWFENINGVMCRALSTASGVFFSTASVSTPVNSGNWNATVQIPSLAASASGYCFQVLGIRNPALNAVVPLVIYIPGSSTINYSIGSVAATTASYAGTWSNATFGTGTFQRIFKAITLPSGNVGVVFLESGTMAAFYTVISIDNAGVISRTTASPLGTPSTNGRSMQIGQGLVNGAAAVVVGSATNNGPLQYIYAGSNNEAFQDFSVIQYLAVA